jgi:peptidyl-prolyl cis-trans isomerase B (cyclophilin B)
MSKTSFPFIGIISFFCLMMITGCGGEKKDVIVFETPYGEMRAVLYDETPIHKENFLKLARSGQYDSIIFHRVIENFMIQTGDLSTGRAEKDADWRLEAEFRPDKYYHKKGALAAARYGDETNPQKKSSGSQFYIIDGDTFDDEGLQTRAERRQFLKLYGLFQRVIKTDKAIELTEKWAYHTNKYAEDTTYDFARAQEGLIMESQSILEKVYKTSLDDPGFNEEQRQLYATVGGAPHLDGEYTVFGQVLEGLEIIDKIAAVSTNDRDKPLEDVRLLVRVETISLSEFEERYGKHLKK